MIIVRAPLRISFVGGGTDIGDFYHTHPGKVISATIDKYVYITINPAPLTRGIHARYSEVENVSHPKLLKNDRIRETMLQLGINNDLEIGVLSHLPVGTGLGSSSSFTVALVKGFSTYIGKRLSKHSIAQTACHIEINKLSQPIGKQDQYAATFGGINIFEFNPDETVTIKPITIHPQTISDLEDHTLIFYTGISRLATSILSDQKAKTKLNIQTLKKMTELVDPFQKMLQAANFKGLGQLLHQNWLNKKSLSPKISTPTIDELYTSSIKAGAWGGKILGAGGGGCLMYITSKKTKTPVREAILETAKKLKLQHFKEFSFKFATRGVEIVSNQR